MPLPVAHGIIGAGVVAAFGTTRTRKLAWVPLLAGAFLAICPDFDFFFVWFLNESSSWHRSFSHSLTFALLAGVIVARLVGRFCLRESIAYATCVLSHCFADILTTKKLPGVQLLWPFLPHRFKLGLFNYLEVRSDAASVLDFAVDALRLGFLELAFCAPLLWLILTRKGRPAEEAAS
jgi:membrane-bound metal-dependent hydrolase YbcI (DUF457 family)